MRQEFLYPRFASLIFLLFGVLPTVTFGSHFYEYCCEISKCSDVIAACNENPSCRSSCAADLSCQPVDQLVIKDYSCFQIHLNNATQAALGVVCNQTYSPFHPPASAFYIDYATCNQNCPGWAPTGSSYSSAWITVMFQFILPAVIFSMTIPRQHKWEASDWLFEFDLNRVNNLPKAVMSLLCAGIIVFVDTMVWVLAIFVGAGPMLVGALHEAVLDFSIVQHLKSINPDPSYAENGETRHSELSEANKVELILAVLSGNLDMSVCDPQSILSEVISLPRAPQIDEGERVTIALNGLEKLDALKKQLDAILQSQYSFGSIVGAPVLFYLVAFSYSLVGLSQDIGNHDTAHSLAFGMWWMVIVHVAIVSGCLLASNNPSTVTGIAAERLATHSPHKTESHSPISFFMRRVYHSPFMPVPLWDRGRMKQKWIESTRSWKASWFRDRIRIRIGWILIPATAFLLIFIPSCLAFIISYMTPRVCLGCRALTFLVYTCCQFVLIAATTYHTASSRGPERAGTLHISSTVAGHLRNTSLISLPVYALSLLVVLVAISISLFTTSAGTLLQMMGAYNNCLCSIPVTTWLTTRDLEMFNLASDTADDRNASKYWAACAYAAIGFMSFVCYLGWWYQRYLRKRLKQRIQALVLWP